MATALEIANQALLRVGAESITALSDTTERARACNASWPFIRRETLRRHSWNSVTVRDTLSANVTAPEWGFDSAYDLPADCLRVLEVDTDHDWRVEERQILIDGTEDIDIRYIKDETDPSDFDSELTEVLVVRLAAEICERVTDSTTKRDLLLQEYERLLLRAMMSDGEEQSDAEFEEDSWITTRY